MNAEFEKSDISVAVDSNGQYVPSAQDPPDFDSYVNRKMERAANALSSPIELMFTASVIFSVSSMPFVIFRALFPDALVAFMSSMWSLLLIPYLVGMALLGMKIASFFGCRGWERLTSPISDAENEKR